MPGSYSSARVGASHRPRLLWIPRVQRPPPLNPGDCSGRGKMPARAAESSPSATQQGSCRVCLLLSPSPHSPCHTVQPLHSPWPRAGLCQVDLGSAPWKRHSFARFTFTSKACCQHPFSLALVKFLPEVHPAKEICSEARTMVKISGANKKRNAIPRKLRDGGTGEEAAPIHPPPAACRRHTHLLGGSNVCYSDPATALRGHSSLCTPAAPCTRGGR